MTNVGTINMNYPMSQIPAGTIELRDDRKKNTWKVAVKPFLLACYPVTLELYNAVSMHSSPLKGRDLDPVVSISWLDATQFCNLLSNKSGLEECYSINPDNETIVCNWNSNGYRLPSEAEWQYACKAGTSGYRYGELDQIAWYQDNSGGGIHEVGGKQPNEWGLYDMLGNVWEWCWDIYDEQVYGSYRIFRGGSWAEEARGCGASCRRRSHPTFSIDDLGFRVARSFL